MNKISKEIKAVLSFIVLIAAFVLGVIIFSSLLIIAAIVGLVFFLIVYIRWKLALKQYKQSSSEHHSIPDKTNDEHKGRIIEHEDQP